MRTLKTYAPSGLNIEDSAWPVPCRSENVCGGLTCLAFFLGLLVRPGTDLGQDFSDMAYIFFKFFYMVYFLIINLLFYVTNLYSMCYFCIIC